MKKIILLFAAVFTGFFIQAQTVSNFDVLPLGADTFWNGSNLSGGFSDGNAFFNNVYDSAYGYWAAGFAYSDMSPDMLNTSDSPLTDTMEYSAVTGSGYGGAGNYAVAYDDDSGSVKIRLTGAAAGGLVYGFELTNSFYAYLSMKYGDAYEHAFSYDSADWFELNITGWFQGNPIADTVHFYLADFRTLTSPGILTTWQSVNLLPLGAVDSLIFTLASSQTGAYGSNTPAYFCMDNFTTANVPTTGAPLAGNAYITIYYDQDTLINVQDYVLNYTNQPLTVTILSGPEIPGAAAIVNDSNDIWYIPGIGVVAQDILVYQVCDTNADCSTAEIYINLIGFTGIEEPAMVENKIYPNPFSNSFYVVHPNDTREIKMYDLQGKLVQDIRCNAYENSTEIYAPDLSAGTYILKMISDEGASVAKIVRQ